MNGPDKPRLSSRVSHRLAALSILQWVNLSAAAVTLVGVPIALLSSLGDHDETWVARGLACYLSVVAALFLVLLVVEEFRWHRKARYAEALSDLHHVHHSIRDAWWFYIQTKNGILVQQNIREALRCFANAFSLVTGVHCRACIKQLLLEDEQADPIERGLVTRTLVRSEDPADLRCDQGVDWLSENSDFLALFRNPQQGYFVGQDLPSMLSSGYRNSHWDPETIREAKFPYRASFVWPIRKKLVGMEVESPMHPDQDLFGYLCIDTEARNVFDTRFDFPVGAAIADGLYPLFRLMYGDQPQTGSPEPALEGDGE